MTIAALPVARPGAAAPSGFLSILAFAILAASTVAVGPARAAPQDPEHGAQVAALPEAPADIAPRAKTQYGIASWYGPRFKHRRTASGEIFEPRKATAAHRHLPLGTRVRVTNLANGRSLTVRVNDRGPYVPGRIIDLSKGAARKLGMVHAGLAPVKIQVVGNDKDKRKPSPDTGEIRTADRD
jgi:rare lipoprotein A